MEGLLSIFLMEQDMNSLLKMVSPTIFLSLIQPMGQKLQQITEMESHMVDKDLLIFKEKFSKIT